ncbi:DUF3307 domain-containing protein [Clostridium sp. D2Q-11]|uniref:DUF3307 domain-containing protein n=1 Tax=Anaeromonas frigoriresistens TaxID=2683708 RepID=A0A942UV15_9FIRM|nr:DUF3307 domain-containing protein [Anaeromonas frigoriresistens]MBS4536941.1 DUF3307 domain-containing protein [Anaeromonas frigoriresistens]
MLEINIFYSLLLAHFLSDFVFQTNKSVNDRLNKKREIYIIANLKHCIIHLITTLLLISFYFSSLSIIKTLAIMIVLIAVHFIIDIFKSIINNIYKYKKYKFEIFLTDQVIHFLFLLIATVLISYDNTSNISIKLMYDIIIPPIKYINLNGKILIVANLIVIGTWGCGIFIKLFLEHLNYKHDKDINEEDYFEDVNISKKSGKMNGGFYIGFLERLFIITAISINMPEVIGFTLATKSIARFKNFDKDKFVEEFIIGSFISFIFAIIIGFLIKKLSVFY